jgi:hypothetical protein
MTATVDRDGSSETFGVTLASPAFGQSHNHIITF